MSSTNKNNADETATGVFPTVKKRRTFRRHTSGQDFKRSFNSIRTNNRTRSVVISLVLLLLGMAVGYGFVAQQRITDTSYASLSESELVTLLDETNNQIVKLESQRSQLSQQLESIQSAANKQQEIERVAQENKDANDILSGTVPVYGPGVRIVISQGTKRHISASILYTLVQELRNAGAEVIQIGNVRVVTSTYIIDSSVGLISDGVLLEPPYIIKAIGNKTNLNNAVEISGGVGSSLRVNFGANVSVLQKDDIEISALANTVHYKYAQTVE